MPKRKGKEISVSGVVAPDWTLIDYKIKPYKDKGIKRDYKSNLNGAMWYIHYEVSDKKITAEYLKYALKEYKDKDKVKLLKILPDYRFSTVGKYTYMMSKGAQLDKDTLDRMHKWFDELVIAAEKEHAKKALEEKTEEKPKKKVISIQQRMRDQTSTLCGEWCVSLDELLDGNANLKDFDPYNEMKAEKTGVAIKPAHAKIIKDMYENEYQEAKLVQEWTDPEIKEAYGHLSSAKIRKEFVAFFEKIFTACDTIINTQKATRRPRKPKIVSKVKLVEKLKYQQSESTLGLASVNPLGIIDASTLWVYNTKNRKLGVYYADEMLGPLTVKGTTIIGFDTNKSTQKTVRKPEEILKGIDKLARTKLDKLYAELKTTEIKLTGRINDSTLLIKVF